MADEPMPLRTSLTEVSPIPQKGIEIVDGILKSGQLFRYGETDGLSSQVSLLESELADYFGKKYAIAVNSGGSALFLALASSGVKAGDCVMLNAFTLAPVPGAIFHAGGEVLLLDITSELTLDIESLRYAIESSNSKVLLLSYMRGHIPNMDEIMKVVDEYDLLLIEDCAHVFGAKWKGQLLGTFGAASCFSFQTYKQLNGGEGGLILTDDENLASKAILMSGSYMLFGQHHCRPSDEVFAKWKNLMPNYSMRLNEISAAAVRSQLPLLAKKLSDWNKIYSNISKGIEDIGGLRIPKQNPDIDSTPTSIQIIADFSTEQIEDAIFKAGGLGVNIKWFGTEAIGFTSTPKDWNYIDNISGLGNNIEIMEKLLDIRLPATLNEADCSTIINIIRYSFDGGN